MMQIISNAMLWSNLQEQSSSNEFTFLCFLGNHQRAWQTKCKMFTLALSRRNDCLIFWFEDSNNFFTFDQIYLIPIFLMADIFDLKLKESKQSWSHLIKCETSLQHLQGVLDRLAASFAPSKGGDEEEEIRWGGKKTWRLPQFSGRESSAGSATRWVSFEARVCRRSRSRGNCWQRSGRPNFSDHIWKQ